jgi:hypothetical protein
MISLFLAAIQKTKFAPYLPRIFFHGVFSFFNNIPLKKSIKTKNTAHDTGQKENFKLYLLPGSHKHRIAPLAAPYLNPVDMIPGTTRHPML